MTYGVMPLEKSETQAKNECTFINVHGHQLVTWGEKSILWVPAPSHSSSKPGWFCRYERAGEVQMSLCSQRISFGTLCFLSSPWMNSFPLGCHCSTVSAPREGTWEHLGSLQCYLSQECSAGAAGDDPLKGGSSRCHFEETSQTPCPCFHVRAEKALAGRDVRK